MNDFIAKPFDIDKSIEVIVKWVSSVSRVDELSIEDLELRLKNHSVPDRSELLQSPSENSETRQKTSSTASDKQSTISNDFDTDVFNLEQALTYWKTEDKLKKFLVRFKAEYLSVDEQLSQLEPAAAEQLAHKLKGASAVLGLQKISYQSKALMEAYTLVSHEGVEQLLVDLKATLNETWTIIDQYTQ
jgi:HPt (histidine-containing phosphotransfer) domain-containing protein